MLNFIQYGKLFEIKALSNYIYRKKITDCPVLSKIFSLKKLYCAHIKIQQILNITGMGKKKRAKINYDASKIIFFTNKNLAPIIE